MTPPPDAAAPVRGTATGTFAVRLVPQPADAHTAGGALGRNTIDKTFTGDLEGTSVGQMLAAMGSVTGSAAYVAIERVTGTLAGRTGAFVLHHTGVMDRGAPSLAVHVAPDTGTDGLTGLRGTMRIVVEPGVHRYEFDYELG